MKINDKGFTLIEILMVVMLVAIMALVAVPQFLDFQTQSKNAATQGALGALRTAIANQKIQMVVKCAAPASAWPEFAAVSGNDITDGTYCAAATLAALTPPLPAIPAADAVFISGEDLPVNPWDDSSTVTDCAVAACTTGGDRSGCSAAATLDGGWCYDDASGIIFANSDNDNENTF